MGYFFFQEGKKVHTGGGFSGKGFKFDEAEAMMVSEKKKFQKAALGMYLICYFSHLVTCKVCSIMSVFIFIQGFRILMMKTWRMTLTSR